MEVFLCQCFQDLWQFVMNLIYGVKSSSFQFDFPPKEEEEATRG